MSDFQIGVMIESFRLGIAEGIAKAAKIGAQGLQMYATRGELSPQNLNQAQRKELFDLIQSNGLVVSALCGDMGGHGFAIAADNPAKVEQSKRIVDLALDLGSNVITTHIGVIPEDQNHERFHIFQEAIGQLGEYAKSVGACFAIETGPEKAATLKLFLDTLGTGGVGVNLDPANFVMVTGQDPVEAVHLLKDYIVHTHAKDGKMIRPSNPEFIYNSFDDEDIEVTYSHYFLETPLGEGDVPFDAYLNALREIGFDGFLTIEREVGENPIADVVKAVDFLKSKI